MRRTITAAILAAPLFLLEAPAGHAATTTIVQSGQAFSETELSLKAGDHVKFVNQDDVNHNVVVIGADDDDEGHDMGVQAPNSTPIDVAFDKAGKFKVRCHIHPGMKLKVDVQ